MSLSFGISAPPPDGDDDGAYLDALVARGHTAHELSFTQGFPWKEKRCRAFGSAAAERGVSLSIHAPYFAVLTSDDPDKAKLTRSAVEHSMKIGAALGARVIVAHTGYTRGRTPEALHELVAESLAVIAPKVRDLGVALGLEVGGSSRAFGTLGDIAMIAGEYSFVHPVVDWAHLHAMSKGALVSVSAFAGVFDFLRANFPSWTIDPLHSQFTDNEFGSAGEIRHVSYGTGTLRVGPMVEAARVAGMSLTLISEAHDEASHDAIQAEAFEVAKEQGDVPVNDDARTVESGLVTLPPTVRVRADGDGWVPTTAAPPLRLTNIDKPFFSDGYTKGDLIGYYAAVAPVLVPHLRDRAIVLARFPNGAEGDWFYEKQAPSHKPEWLPTVSLWSEHRGDDIDFVTAGDAGSLMWIANLGAIEIHPWLSRVDTFDRPDFAVFDLDPAEGSSWDQVVAVAEMIRVALDRLGLVGYPKTSGSTGIHIYVPLDPVHEDARARLFVDAVARLLVSTDPSLVTLEHDIPKRHGKVFVDVNQNVGGKTIASVYSVRPRAGAPISTPILWEELDSVDPSAFTIGT
ncbi:MAG TPA: non-homologous end-joining DNA ligase, partial [Acidimicrobiia bacterium]|nr:non-homologous end-joining DNA ligase [Acidimicrobiia bacterium]